MAGFDPSVIGNIPDYAPDPVAAKAQGFKLADLVNTEQLNQLRVNQLKTEESESLKMKELLKKEDLSTPQGITKAAQSLTKAGLAQQGMKLMGTAQQYQTGQIENETAKLENAAKKQDQVALALDNVYGQLQKLEAAGATPETLDLAAAQLAKPAIQRLRNSIPEMGPYLDQFVANPKNLTFAGIKQAEDASNKVQALVKERLAERQQTTREQHEAEVEREDRAKDRDRGSGQFTGASADLMAALAERGVSLPSGFRSKQQQAAMFNALIERNLGKSADEIADDIKSGKLKLTAETKAAGVAGGQIGKVALASNELDTFGDQTLAASKALGRGFAGIDKSLTINGLIQMGESQVSDPKLLTLRAKLNALNNAYDQLSARGGTDKDKRAHIHTLFDSRLSEEGIQALVKALKEEAVGAREAANRTIAETSGKNIPGTGQAPESPAGGASEVKAFSDPDKERRYQEWKKTHASQ